MASPRRGPGRRRRATSPSLVPQVRVHVVRSAPASDPHAHAVCRGCGRIQEIELSELDRHLLTELAAQAPEEWAVERIAFSLSGTCRRCREGRSTP